LLTSEKARRTSAKFKWGRRDKQGPGGSKMDKTDENQNDDKVGPDTEGEGNGVEPLASQGYEQGLEFCPYGLETKRGKDDKWSEPIVRVTLEIDVWASVVPRGHRRMGRRGVNRRKNMKEGRGK